MGSSYHNIIKGICEELNIQFTLLSRNWIIMLEKDNKRKYITGYKFDLNTQGTSNIIDDKYALYEVLIKNNIPIIKHSIIYNSDNNNSYAQGYNDYSKVLSFFKKHNNHIVIKSNTGTCGNQVYNITREKDIITVLKNLFVNNYSISICPYYDIENEYRAIVLKNKVLLIYKKIKPVVFGDGTSTIKDLLLKFNYNYFKDKLKDNKYDRVLNINEIYEYNWQFNLSKGAKIGEVDSNIKKEITNLALKVATAINLNFGSVDIIKTKDNELFVMEANSGVMMKNYINNEKEGHEMAKIIYKKAIEEMFKEYYGDDQR